MVLIIYDCNIQIRHLFNTFSVLDEVTMSLKTWFQPAFDFYSRYGNQLFLLLFFNLLAIPYLIQCSHLCMSKIIGGISRKLIFIYYEYLCRLPISFFYSCCLSVRKPPRLVASAQQERLQLSTFPAASIVCTGLRSVGRPSAAAGRIVIIIFALNALVIVNFPSQDQRNDLYLW